MDSLFNEFKKYQEVENYREVYPHHHVEEHLG